MMNFHLKEALNNSDLMRLSRKTGKFKATIARYSTAMAQIFNAEIVCFACGIANYELFRASLSE